MTTVRAVRLHSDLSGTTHPARRAKFVSEIILTLLTRLNDFGERWRIASLVPLISEFDTVLNEAGIALFERRTTCSPEPTR